MAQVHQESPTNEAMSDQELARPSDRRWMRVAGWGLSFAALLAVLVGVLPELLREAAVSRLTTELGRSVSIQNVDFNPFTGSFAMTGLALEGRDGHEPVLELDSVRGVLRYLPLFSGDLTLAVLEVMAPTLRLERVGPSAWNVSDLVSALNEPSSESEPQQVVTIEKLHLRKGRVTLHDAATPDAQPITVEHIDFKAKDLSTAEGHAASVYLSADSTQDSQIVVGGRLRSDFHTGTLHVDVRQLPLAMIQPYLEPAFALEGSLHARATVDWPGTDDSRMVIRGDLGTEKLTISKGQQPIAQFEQVGATGVNIQWPTRTAITHLDLVQPELWIRRESDGRFQILEALNAGRNDTASRNGQTAPEASHSEWEPLVLGQVNVNRGSLHVIDRAVSPPYDTTIEAVSLEISHVTPDPGEGWNVTGKANLPQGGSFTVQGTAQLLAPEPVADLRLTVLNFSIPSINPYLRDVVSHAATRGKVQDTVSLKLHGSTLDVVNDLNFIDLKVEEARGPDVVQKRLGLPLEFLIELLKDVYGNIQVTLPVTGQLGNPAFHWGDAVWTSVRNAVIHLVTLPFRSIGTLVMRDGKIDEFRIDPIRFEPGQPTLSPDAEEHLSEIASLLMKTSHIELGVVPVITEADRKTFDVQPRNTWAVIASTPGQAARFLAVRRAHLVAVRLRDLGELPAERVTVREPRPAQNHQGNVRVEFEVVPTTS